MAKQESRHHYAFIHRAFREASLHHPLAVLAVLASPRRDDFIQSLLDAVDKGEGTDPPRDFSLADIRVHCVRIGRNNPCAIIEMPEPRNPAEAYFAALLVKSSLSDDPTAEEFGKAQIGYYVLERSAFLSEPTDTMLCEWTIGDKHVNYGKGPEPTLDAFVESLRHFCKTSPDGQGASGHRDEPA